MKTSKRKADKQFKSAPAIHSPKLPPSVEEVRKRAHEIYVARGGANGLALNDWLSAEEELKRKLEE
jgi:hypothetical protein